MADIPDAREIAKRLGIALIEVEELERPPADPLDQYTREEVGVVLNYWGRKSKEAIAKAIGCSGHKVNRIGFLLGLPGAKKRGQ